MRRAFGVTALAVVLALPIAARGQACTGCTPLDDASGPPYLGTIALGLYPGSTNTPPPAHAALASQAASSIVPRDAAGVADPDGWIGLITIGMSNTNQESAAFERAEDERTARNPRVVIVDCAVGGQSAEVIVNRLDPYWTIVDQRVAAAGLDADQVQAVWLKEADGFVSTTSFPAHAETLETHLRGIVRHLRDRFPALQICYMSSRIYGGYSSNPARGEPLTYETGFAVRDVIAAQIAGDPYVNADPTAGPVEAPVLLWGPYLWANGTIPRASDGLVWLLADLEGDHVHPSPSGEAKVAGLLGDFFTTNVHATPWYMAGAGSSLTTHDAVADAYIDTNQSGANFGTASELAFSFSNVRSYVRFDLSSVTDAVVHAKLSFVTPPDVATRPSEIVGVSNTIWTELGITGGNAPVLDGPVHGVIPQASRGTSVSLDVTTAVQAALGTPGALLSLAVLAVPSPPTAQEYMSRETRSVPRLVLVTTPDATDVTWPRHGTALLGLAIEKERDRAVVRLTVAGDASDGVVEIVDVRGRKVRTLVRGASWAAGARAVAWDGLDLRGQRVSNGVYWVRAQASIANERATASEKLVWSP